MQSRREVALQLTEELKKIGNLTERKIVDQASLGKNWLTELRGGNHEPHESNVQALRDLLEKVKLEKEFGPAETPGRRREKVLAAIQGMSDVSIESIYAPVMRAMRDELLRQFPSELNAKQREEIQRLRTRVRQLESQATQGGASTGTDN